MRALTDTNTGSLTLCLQADYDWAAAAERAGDAVLAVNSDILVIVEGAGLVEVEVVMMISPCSGLEYAGTVEGARSRPVSLSRPRQLLYSGHLYPWFMQSGMSYGELSQMMDSRQTFVMEPGHDYSVARSHCDISIVLFSLYG